MKKLYSKSGLVRTVTLGAAVATLLSSVSPIVSPVFAAGVSTTGGVVRNSSGLDVPYPHGSHGSIVFAGDDDFCGADSVVGRGGKQQASISDDRRISAKDQYERFVGEKQFGGRSPYGTTTEKETWISPGVTSGSGAYMGTQTFGVANAMPEAYGIYSFATGCGSAATGNYSTVFGAGATAKAGGAQAFGVSALASGIASVAMGVDSEASGLSAVAVGGLATALGKNSVAMGTRARAESNYAIAIGSEAEAQASGAIAIGSRRSDRTEENDPNRKVEAKAENAIAIGTFAYAETEDSVAIGVNSQVLVKDGVAVGGGAISDRDKGMAGYDPHTNVASTKTGIAWKSTTAAFSVGEVGGKGNGTLTRQITGVAAGSQDTDAVNVAQLKALRSVIAEGEGWKISVNDKDSTDVTPGSTVDFSVTYKEEAGKDNLKIEKESGDDKQKVKFSLSDTLNLTSVTTGQASMSDDGFMIQGGPKITIDGFAFDGDDTPSITIDGIDAGKQKITNVADATSDHDAVNYKQLKEIQKGIKTSWVLSVNGKDATNIGPNGGVNLQSAGDEDNQNIRITKNENNTVEFGLADNINVMSVTAGKSIINAAGFKFVGGNGPSITVNGIHAGNQTIRGVAAGKEDTDAVNFAQLNEIKNEITENSLVKWDERAKVIFIGRQKDGTIIDISNKDGGLRVITGVAEAKYDDDAVSYKQLKDVKALAENGWKLSVDGNNATDVKAGSTVDLVAGASGDSHKNIKIEKDNNNKITFSLNDNLKLTSVTTGRSIMSDNGFGFEGNKGPRIAFDGIDAGNQKITKVKAGTEATDAVNFAQLNEIKNEMAGNSLVKWVEGQKLITIGAEKDGTRINITNSQGEARIISGVDAGNVATDSTEAVNGGQLFRLSNAFNSKITDMGKTISQYFGGGSSYENGTWTGPTFNILQPDEDGIFTNTQHNNVADAFRGVNSSITNLHNKIFDITENSLVKWDEDGKFITIGAEKGGIEIKVANSEGENRIISGVAVGKVSSDSTEAINGHQLFNYAANISKYFGGETDVIDGFKPTFTVQNKEHHNVTDAFTDVDASITDIYNQINNVTDNSLVKWNKGQKLITIGAEKGGTKIDITGTEGERTIAGVKNGMISEDSKEAINGSQINKISGDIAKFFGGNAAFQDGAFAGPRYNLSIVSADGTVKQEEYTDVGSALTGLDANVKNVNSRLTYVTNEFNQKFDDFSKDALLWSEEEQAFVALHGPNGEKTESKITYLLDGDISEDSADAINGSQLYNMGDKIANYFGGGASYKDGEWHAPTFHVYNINNNGTASKKPYSNVADAFEGVNNTFANIHNQISNITENSLVQQEEENAPITIGAKTGGSVINIANNERRERVITGVAEGEIAKGSTDAVNGAQLFDISEEVNELYTEGTRILTNVSNYFGGGADVFKDKAPTYIIQGNTHNDVGSAFKNVDNSITDIYNQINKVTENTLVKQEGGSEGLITVGKATGGTKISIANKNNEDRTLSGVKDGTLSIISTEAVNGSQLFTTNQNVNAVKGDLKKVAENTSKYFGGSTDVLAGIEPTFLIQDQRYHNVTDAFTGVNVSINNIDNKISDLEKNNLVQQEGGASGVITIGAKTAGTKISVASIGGARRTIAGVKAAENGDEAVNKDQLDKSIEKISNDIEIASAAAVLYDKDANGGINYNSVTLGGKKTDGPVALLNVKDGRIAEESYDAINGSQLYFMSNQLAAYFGGGAKYENGKWTAPNFVISQVNADGKIVENKYNNVADAFGGINNGMSNINNRIDDVINKVDSDALKWNKDKGAYDASHGGQPSKIINVADGRIAEDSKDAVNGGQLWKTNERITGVEKDIKHIENRVDNISATVTNIGETVHNIDIKVDKIDNKVNDLVDGVVLYDRDANGKKVNKVTLIGGNESEPVTIDNVADGKIEQGSKEAVNGGQLHGYTKEQMKIVLDESKHYTDQRVNNIVIDAIDDAVERANNYTNMKFEALNYSIENVRKEAKQAAAIGLAVSNLRYNETPGKLSVAFGSGLWRGQSAFALGAGYSSEDGKIRSNLSATSSGGHWGVGLGLNLTLN